MILSPCGLCAPRYWDAQATESGVYRINKNLEGNMGYFITGSTGFIGRFLVPQLLQRGATVYLLVREASLPRLDKLRQQWQVKPSRVVGVVGDLSEPNLGVSDQDIAMLRGTVKHFFHLAALYDLNASEEELEIANVEGTRHAVALAEAMGVKCFHHISSIAVAGLYPGVFREDMFEEATNLKNAYLRTKHDSERIVRQNCKVPWRIYRPGIVIGHSQTGEMDRVNGPYLFFKSLQKLRKTLPQWMPTIGIEGGRPNIVPVDFVVSALDHIAHLPGEDRKCFHLTDPDPYRVGEVINIFAEAGHAPRMALRFDTRMLGFIPPLVRETVRRNPLVQRLTGAVLDDLEIPRSVLDFVNYPTRFDCRETERCLKGTSIKVPRLPDYAPVIWDYWERHLDPELDQEQILRTRVENKVCLVTGASSGIGKATAVKLAEAGAIVIICARSQAGLDATLSEIRQKGGQGYAYTCDLSLAEDCDRLVQQVLQDHGRCDILVNNAGRSIRRSVAQSFERFHDFERTMQLNYFGALRLILGFAPSMLERGSGQIINISTLGVLTSVPRFSGYVASKAALDAFSRCAAAEWSDKGVVFTTINMPLVRTPMIQPSRVYDNLPALTPEEAADKVVQAIIQRPRRIAPPLGVFAQIAQALAPRLTEMVLNTGYKMFPEEDEKSEKAAREQEGESEKMMLLALMRGVHW